MAVADELLARLRAVPGIASAFDTSAPDRHPFGASPTLILQHVSTVPTHSIDGALALDEDRWQVSVIGANLANVRTVAQAVRDSLHGYRSDAIKYVSFESAPGEFSEGSGATREHHAPVDFIVTT
jgi:hypothetical protein